MIDMNALQEGALTQSLLPESEHCSPPKVASESSFLTSSFTASVSSKDLDASMVFFKAFSQDCQRMAQ